MGWRELLSTSRIGCRIAALPPRSSVRRRRAAMFDKFLAYGMTRGMLRAGAVMTGILFLISYIVDVTLAAVGMSPAATVLNDAVIALIAASVLIFYLFSSRTEQIF